MSFWNKLFDTKHQPPAPIATGLVPANDDSQSIPLFMRISVTRLILMSILSFGFYQLYWMCRNWDYIKERDNRSISPFWRAAFCFFYCYSLLRHIHEDKESRSVQSPSFSPGGLATGWIVLTIISIMLFRNPGPFYSTGDSIITIVSALIPSFLCLVPVQNYVNSVAKQRSPGQPFDRWWSWGHIVSGIIGFMVWGKVLTNLTE